MTNQEAADRDSREDERRWFKTREFKALLAAQDGRCADCGEVLEPLDIEHVFWGENPDAGAQGRRLLCPKCAQPAPKLSPSEAWHQAMQILINRTPAEQREAEKAARQRLAKVREAGPFGIKRRCPSPQSRENDFRHRWRLPEPAQCVFCGYVRSE